MEEWLFFYSRKVVEKVKMPLKTQVANKMLQCVVYTDMGVRGRQKEVILLLFPDTIKILEQMGEQIKLARLRRNLSVELVSERANISRATLWAIEKGSPSVAIGYYAAVLHALNYMIRIFCWWLRTINSGERFRI